MTDGVRFNVGHSSFLQESSRRLYPETLRELTDQLDKQITSSGEAARMWGNGKLSDDSPVTVFGTIFNRNTLTAKDQGNLNEDNIYFTNHGSTVTCLALSGSAKLISAGVGKDTQGSKPAIFLWEQMRSDAAKTIQIAGDTLPNTIYSMVVKGTGEIAYGTREKRLGNGFKCGYTAVVNTIQIKDESSLERKGNIVRADKVGKPMTCHKLFKTGGKAEHLVIPKDNEIAFSSRETIEREGAFQKADAIIYSENEELRINSPLIFHSQLNELVYRSAVRKISFWNKEYGTCTYTFQDTNLIDITSLLEDPYHKQPADATEIRTGRIAVGFQSGHVGLLEVMRANDKEVHAQEPRTFRMLNGSYPKDPVSCLAWLPGDKLVSGGTEGSVTIWDPQSASILYTLSNSHTKRVSSLAILPSGLLASAGHDNKLIIWNLEKYPRLDNVCKEALKILQRNLPSSDPAFLDPSQIDPSQRDSSITQARLKQSIYFEAFGKRFQQFYTDGIGDLSLRDKAIKIIPAISSKIPAFGPIVSEGLKALDKHVKDVYRGRIRVFFAYGEKEKLIRERLKTNLYRLQESRIQELPIAADYSLFEQIKNTLTLTTETLNPIQLKALRDTLEIFEAIGAGRLERSIVGSDDQLARDIDRFMRVPPTSE